MSEEHPIENAEFYRVENWDGSGFEAGGCYIEDGEVMFVDGFFGSGPRSQPEDTDPDEIVDRWDSDDGWDAYDSGTTGDPVLPPKHTTDTLLNQLVFLTAEEAANGCTKVIQLSDGRKAEVTIPAGIEANGHVDVPGQGRLDASTGMRGILRLSFMIT